MSGQSVNAFQTGATNEAKNAANMFPVSPLNVMSAENQGNVFPVTAMLPGFTNQGNVVQGYVFLHRTFYQ